MLKMPKLANKSKWLLLVLCMLLNTLIHPGAFAVNATDDITNVSPCELESIINQLMNPSPEYQLHASALRNQLKNILRERQFSEDGAQSVGDYNDYTDEDKRSVAALAAQGLLHPGAKRSIANLAKNGQLPTPDPEDYLDEETNEELNEQKRYVGTLARSGGILSYGKRNIGTLARDFQLPSGKRNVATIERLGMLSSTNREGKRNVAAVARYKTQHRSGRVAAEKRNLGALKGSPVHGMQQKREEQLLLPAASPSILDTDYDWLYPSYADLDWGDFGRVQKRFLDTSKDPELFGIEHAGLNKADNEVDEDAAVQPIEVMPEQEKRHIGAVYRSGFLPTYRYLRSNTGGSNADHYGGNSGIGGSGRFSRSGRARQFVEYYHPHERLRQPIAAVCKRCFLPNRPMMNWNNAGIRGRLTKYYIDSQQADNKNSIATNSLPTGTHYRPSVVASRFGTFPRTETKFYTWGTPPRITALHRREFRHNGPMQNLRKTI